MRRILVLRGGALGDFIVTLPALGLLRQRWPEARIELAGNAAAAQLARARGLLDAVHSQHEARWSALFGAAPLPAAFAAWLADFDLVINYWPDPDGELRRRFPRRAGQTFLSAAALPARAPAAAHYCEPLRPLGLEAASYFFRLEGGSCAPHAGISASADRPRAERTAHPILIHPGSGSPRKNWPLARWLALLPALPGPVAFLLGEAERDLAARIADSPTPVATFSQLPLETLVGHLARARLFLGHDSGISHLAAACGAPCCLLFGPTDPALWAPPAPSVRTLRAGPELSSLSVEAVHRAVQAALADRT